MTNSFTSEASLFFASESVTEGHPDKLCDQISDAILDAIIEQDPYARVACEVAVTMGLVMVLGEITTSCYVEIPDIVRQVVKDVGYNRPEYGFNFETLATMVSIKQQSADISAGVSQALETRGTSESEDELDRLVEEWTINHSAEEVMNMMQAAGVAAGVLESGEDLLENDPQLRHRQFFRELDHPEMGKYRAPRQSFTLSKAPCELRRAPLLGEHNEYVLKEILGMSDEEIAKLVIDGVLE